MIAGLGQVVVLLFSDETPVIYPKIMRMSGSANVKLRSKTTVDTEGCAQKCPVRQGTLWLMAAHSEQFINAEVGCE